jgi:hypothetical protein
MTSGGRIAVARPHRPKLRRRGSRGLPEPNRAYGDAHTLLPIGSSNGELRAGDFGRLTDQDSVR